MGLYKFLCVLKDPKRCFFVSIGSHGSLKALLHRHGFQWILMYFYKSLCVLLCPYWFL